MMPVLNLLFFWTNVVGKFRDFMMEIMHRDGAEKSVSDFISFYPSKGAALWVADEIEADRRRERIASRLAPGQEQGSHYVTFHPYDSSRPGLPTEPLLQSHDY